MCVAGREAGGAFMAAIAIALKAGRSVSPDLTKSYGCSVKYS